MSSKCIDGIGGLRHVAISKGPCSGAGPTDKRSIGAQAASALADIAACRRLPIPIGISMTCHHDAPAQNWRRPCRARLGDHFSQSSSDRGGITGATTCRLSLAFPTSGSGVALCCLAGAWKFCGSGCPLCRWGHQDSHYGNGSADEQLDETLSKARPSSLYVLFFFLLRVYISDAGRRRRRLIVVRVPACLALAASPSKVVEDRSSSFICGALARKPICNDGGKYLWF